MVFWRELLTVVPRLDALCQKITQKEVGKRKPLDSFYITENLHTRSYRGDSGYTPDEMAGYATGLGNIPRVAR